MSNQTLTDSEKGIIVQPRKKRTLKDIIGLVKAEGDAVESKSGSRRDLNDLCGFLIFYRPGKRKGQVA